MYLELMLELGRTGKHKPSAVALVVRYEELRRKFRHLENTSKAEIQMQPT